MMDTIRARGIRVSEMARLLGRQAEALRVTVDELFQRQKADSSLEPVLLSAVTAQEAFWKTIATVMLAGKEQ